MNRICLLWEKHENTLKYDGTDSVIIEGQKFQIEGIDDMAVRKKPVTEPVRDNDVVNKNKKAEKSLIVHHLSNDDFNSLIFYLLQSPAHRAQIIRTATWEALKRLRIKRDSSKAIIKTPKVISSQGDAGSIIVWISKIQPNHKKSIVQLVAIDATAVSRAN